LSLLRCLLIITTDAKRVRWFVGQVPLASLTICRSRNVGEDDGDDESVESESLSENEDQDHSDKDIFLSVCAHTCVTDDADGETGSQG